MFRGVPGCSARCFSGCRTLLCRKELRVAAFARLAVAAVGLTNLALLAWFSRSGLDGVAGYPFFWWTAEVAWTETLSSVFLVVAVGLLTSEIVLRKLRPLRESFLHRYGIMVSAVCLGEVLTGFLVATLFAGDGTLGAEVSITPETTPYAVIGASLTGLVGPC